MNKVAVARELIQVAKLLSSGTWALPKNSSDVNKIMNIVRKMDSGTLPRNPTLTDTFQKVLGDDKLFDMFDKYEELEEDHEEFLKKCAQAVRRRVTELAKKGVGGVGGEEKTKALKELVNQLK